jgi:hypothetical protein
MRHIMALLATVALGCGGTTGLSGQTDPMDTSTDTATDTLSDPDAVIPPADCTPARVAGHVCDSCFVDSFLGAYFTGSECFELWGCACYGPGCTDRYDSVAECDAAHVGCEGSLCTTTGGIWLPSTPCGPCGHFICGLPTGARCCEEGCDCGPGNTFIETAGCRPDPGCTREQLCTASGGIWYADDPCGPCGDYWCGDAPLLGCCTPGCDCGAGRNFFDGEGCKVDDECDATTSELCTSTGGTWYPDVTCGPCGHYICGRPTGDACCDEGCDCGPTANYETGLGCVYEPECPVGEVMQPCYGTGYESSCRAGLACCPTCDIGFGCPACLEPCCPTSPDCAADGCSLPPHFP